ncbi:MAG: hypothetical protein Q4G28_01515 [Neisseria sp.]|nr:hypothetical protein [Neisseria sp.]
MATAINEALKPNKLPIVIKLAEPPDSLELRLPLAASNSDTATQLWVVSFQMVL